MFIISDNSSCFANSCLSVSVENVASTSHRPSNYSHLKQIIIYSEFKAQYPLAFILVGIRPDYET